MIYECSACGSKFEKYHTKCAACGKIKTERLITVTEKQWFEIGDGFKTITPLTKRRQVAEQAIVKDGSMRMLTEGIDFIVSDKEGGRYANNTND